MPRARSSARSELNRALEPLRTFLSGRIEEGLVPGAVFAVGRAEGAPYVEALGRRALAPRAETMTARTIFDLASLTKPMVTAPLAAELAASGVVGLDVSIGRYL